MGKKEANRLRMLGVLPSQGADPIPVGKIPDGGTQVINHQVADASTVILRTVTTGTTLYLTATHLFIFNASAATKYGMIFVTNAADIQQYRILYFTLITQTNYSDGMSFFPPLEIPAGWKVKLLSSFAAVQVTGFIHGYEA